MDSRAIATGCEKGIGIGRHDRGIPARKVTEVARHPLDGAKLKVVRAEKHLQSLKDEIATYLSKNPYEFPVEDDGKTVTARSAVIKNGCESPEELSCILSECITPLRSALEYIAWELATRFAASAPIVGKDKSIHFPILNDPDGDGMDRFAKMAQKYAFSADAIDCIKSVQPYYDTRWKPLAILGSLRNRDEHCLELLTIAYTNTSSLDVVATGGTLEQCILDRAAGSCATVSASNVTRMEVRRLTAEEVEETDGDSSGTHFTASVAFNAPAPRSAEEKPRSVKVDGQVSVFISLDNVPMPLVPIERTVEQLVECVANIIPRFEQFFI